MTNYLFAFRGTLDPDSPATQEAVWRTWFARLGEAIVDWGHRVGHCTTVRAERPAHPAPDSLTGYLVVRAESMDQATELAKGCPILPAGGSVEVGETFD